MLFPQLRINLTDDVYVRHVSIARKTGHLLSLSVINNALQIVREKEITNYGKWGNGASEILKSFSICSITGNVDQKEFSLFILLFAQLYRRFTL